ncbi:MAG: nucleotidyltransferase family protein [Paludibacteraceae bacterium]|nr:nucleotidyltransferase family protein [Paludibacteraceae bacterium]
MRAMIFAAGLGTRLKPLTDTMPKALVPLAGKPLLQWQIERLRDAGITDIVVNVHHFPDMIIDAVRANNGWGCHVQISDERDCLLETGGGLRKAKKLLDNEPVLVCNVDILSNIDLHAVVEAYNRQSALSSHRLLGLLVVSERKTQRYLLFDEENRLQGWTNIATGEVRPQSLSAISNQHSAFRKLAFSGMQILSPRVFDKMDRVVAEKGDKFSLIDLYLSICQDELLTAYVPHDYRMMDVGKIDQLEDAERFAESL